MKQVLDEADLPHILRLKHRQLFRDVVGIHIPVAGDQQFLAVFLHQREEAAPLVAHPHRLEVFPLGTDHQHRLRRIQRGEDVGFVLLTELALERDPGEEDLIALLGQRVVDLLRHHRIAGAFAGVVALLVAEEDVEGFLLTGNGEDAFLNFGDALRFRLVDAALRAARLLQRGQIIPVAEDGVVAQAVAGGDPFPARGVLHILDAVAAEHQPPVGFRIVGVGVDHLFVRRRRLVVIVHPAEVFRPIVKLFVLLPADHGERGEGAAVGTLPAGHALRKLHHPPAHLTLDRRHLAMPFTSASATHRRAS